VIARRRAGARRRLRVGLVMLLNRLAERTALGRLLEAARGGRSAVLLVQGEPGVGKTALLEDAVEAAAGFRVAWAIGVESEIELAFAALHQLCTPMTDRLERLPPPQQDALAVAFGLRTGEAPDRFLVGLAALNLLAETAAEQPLLCVIDDAQWLDRASAQALGFVARRLLAEPVALVVAAREPGQEFRGLPELAVGGLAVADARELLGRVIRGPLDDRVRDRIIAETRGNPLALLELPGGLTPEELTAGLLAPGRIEDGFRRRYEALPADTQQLVLVAAAEPAGDPVLVWRAAGELGIGMEAAAAAETAGLVAIGQRVTFRHPLVRSAVYRAAAPAERRATHQALAEVTDPRADPDRRAWHRAQAAAGPDEEVAAELDRSAGRAQARGGLAAAAAFLQRSAALTLDPVRRAERVLAAAQARYQSGAFDAALGMVAAAEAGPLDAVQRARADLLRGQVAFASSRSGDAPLLLLKAARQFAELDVRLARETCLEALAAALFTDVADLRDVAAAALAAPSPLPPARAPDLLLDGMAVLATEGYRAGIPLLKQAVRAFREADVSTEEELRWLWLACHVAGLVWDYESMDLLSARQLALARAVGALTALPTALGTRAGVHLFAGDFADAASLAAEAALVTEAIGSSIAPFGALGLAAFRGRPAASVELLKAVNVDEQHPAEGIGLIFVQWATAVLCNGLGRYEQALAAAQQASADSPARRFTGRALAEVVEAATRTGAADQAADALRRLAESTGASGTDWGLGVEARSRALVSEGETAEALYREAIDRLGRARLRMELGRAHLVYGEWLRRQRRIRDARDQLRRAHELFTEVGMEAFADRARLELRAAGVRTRSPQTGMHDTLTAQEALIARLAGAGASNPEIAAQLFISRATVAYHLRKVYTKLGVSSRTQLARVLPVRSGPAASAAPQH
jgi:DNA-binding CsgD family transcriptional regulator